MGPQPRGDGVEADSAARLRDGRHRQLRVKVVDDTFRLPLDGLLGAKDVPHHGGLPAARRPDNESHLPLSRLDGHLQVPLEPLLLALGHVKRRLHLPSSDAARDLGLNGYVDVHRSTPIKK
jgi:hypothetical protein